MPLSFSSFLKVWCLTILATWQSGRFEALGGQGATPHRVKVRYHQFKKQAISIKRPLKTEQFLCKNLYSEMNIFSDKHIFMLYDITDGDCVTKYCNVKLGKECVIFHPYKLKIKEY